MIEPIARVRHATGLSMLLGALVVCVPAWAQQPPDEGFKGRPLENVLRSFQAQGLPIVFTSSIVTPDLRVRVEPRAVNKRQQLDEILGASGLEARNGPGGTIQIVKARRPQIQELSAHGISTGTLEGRAIHGVSGIPLPGATLQIDDHARQVRTDPTGRFVMRRVAQGSRVIRASLVGFAPVEREVQLSAGATVSIMIIFDPMPGTHSEHLIVTETVDHRRDRGVATEATLDWKEWRRTPPGVLDHPMRAVHALPRVTALDDLRSEFTVRASALRHIGFVVDGVSTPWLKHSVGRGASASLTMLTGHVIEKATLRAGAYPRRNDERLGAELEFTVREGSREEFQLRGAVGGPNATLVAEGPLGASGHGSWLVAGRQSYLEWPSRRAESDRAAFGFSDGLAKAVYDVTPSQQLAVTVLGGRSGVDVEEEDLPDQASDVVSQASLVNVSWRSAMSPSIVVSQRAYHGRYRFEEAPEDQGIPGGTAIAESGYRADLTASVAQGIFEAGVHVSRWTHPESAVAAEMRAAYAHFAWAAAPALTISPGVRVTSSTGLVTPTLTPWILGEWTFRPRWILSTSAGVTHQGLNLATFHQTRALTDRSAEHATHFDFAIEQRVSRFTRWQATVFNRVEQNVGDPQTGTNTLRGRSRGLEVIIDRQQPLGLSGMAAYVYGKARYDDIDHRQTFWADLDQRHGFNASGAYRFSDRTAVGATFRASTNTPIPGYFAVRDGRLFVANRRNEVRLPAYARLDLNAQRRFAYHGRRLTLFAEMLNVLNRSNVGRASGVLQPTGEALGFTARLQPRSVTAGVVIEF